MSIQTDDVLRMARDLWSKQHELTIDQIDGSFYWRVCRWNEVKDFLSEAEAKSRAGQVHPYWLQFHLRQLIPNTMPVVFWGSSDVIPQYPDMYGAVDLGQRVEISDVRLKPTGGFETGRASNTSQYLWTQIGIRNADWRGDDVETAIRELHQRVASPNVMKTIPPYPPGESVMMVAAKLYRDGEYKEGFYWNPESDHPDIPDLDLAEKRLRESEAQSLTIDEAIPEHWHSFSRGAMVSIAVADPLPPEGIIAAYYDATVVKQRGWQKELPGASNGQDVPTAIRTWATGLLIHSGLTHRQAVGSLHTGPYGIGGKEVSFQRFSADRRRLIARSPESEPFLRPAR